MGVEATIFQTLVGCLNHWATKNSSDKQVILWADITVILIKIEKRKQRTNYRKTKQRTTSYWIFACPP